jgi:hypothetical protein
MVSSRVALSLSLLVAGALMYGHTQVKDVVAQTKALGRVKKAQVNETAPAGANATLKELQKHNPTQDAGTIYRQALRPVTVPAGFERKMISKSDWDLLDGSAQIEIWVHIPKRTRR